MALEDSSATTESCRSEKPTCVIWGGQLDGENPTYTFDVPEEWSYDQQLSLRTICLGENAKDEINIVEIMPPKDSKASTAVHVATLKLSVLPMATLVGLDLTPPVTFRLKSGSGPVYLAGQHLSVGFPWEGDGAQEECSEEGDETENSSKEESPMKPVKSQPHKHASIAKKEQQLSDQEQSLGRKASRKRKPAVKGELRL
ncbi:nucleoplasmin-like [Rhineura floridana]|uniref:nucleoplasmin-like n=1 Tax=Rhineura floridana TaxID=261503 RepID=UPI002AC80A63|nr:nucleoplasmin-like [Rhineura floridana]XP_061448660.1 nucleoplasmin-like [Rhineura floridana]XP_061448662.1 nucleoplasmin-like [Rhineura floridana]XP_061448663.1 nucleoplasmin-like [Rhineura floridana]XP_061448664.1 nucleoplasmin-like [Rhineura floridana]